MRLLGRRRFPHSMNINTFNGKNSRGAQKDGFVWEVQKLMKRINNEEKTPQQFSSERQVEHHRPHSAHETKIQHQLDRKLSHSY